MPPYRRRLPIPKDRDGLYYTQNFAVGTVMVGFKAAVGVTQGTLIVLRRSVGGGVSSAQRKLKPGVIETRRVVVPVSKDPIEVDVLYLEENALVSAVLEDYKNIYGDIQVYAEDEVQILE